MADGGSIPLWSARRRLPLVIQSEVAECALACLSMVARYYGYDTDLPSMRRRFNSSVKGMNMAHILKIAHALGFEARPLRIELDQLSKMRMPCILHWDLNHFVVLSRVTRRGVEIHDPARGRVLMPLSAASDHFTGIVLELAPGTSFSRIRDRERINLRALAGRVNGLIGVVTQILGIALAIEILALSLPFQMQWVVDQVLVSADEPLLLLMTLGFSAILVLQTGLNVARAWILSWLSAELGTQWITNLISHLLKLPLDFFGKRQMGDVMSRFVSVQVIQATITGGFVEAILDGAMGSLAFVILCVYSIPLSVVVLAAFLIYGLLRWLAYRTQWQANEEQMLCSAKQQTLLMESVRGVQAIKLANKEGERSARLATATLDAMQSSMRNQRITLTFSAVNQGIFGLQRIFLIALGALLAIHGKLSAGMLIAFVSYADQFTTKIGNLIDKLVEFNMLRLHGERIADIALQSPEQNVHGVYSGPQPEPSLTMRNVSFRYATDEPWVLRSIDLFIASGESVAIVGPSGCGKSTLAKLIVGLLVPNEGRIEIGGVEIQKYGLGNYRQLIGTVMQDDPLFAGTIADNIAFFDPDASIAAVIDAARMAEIHDDIMAMTMGYESLVGDMGSALSGGQRQRVVLARAFYRQPKILVLDEATSHLDVNLERRINASVRTGSATRIIIAHRPETIASADRVIDLGKFTSSRMG
jgi:ATP-binding cassette subfamily B protein RaxB